MRITPVTVAETDALGDKIAPVLAAAIGRTLRTVTRRWRTVGKASVDDLAAIAPAWARQVEHELMPAIAEAYWQGVNGLLDPLTEALTAAAPPTSLPDPWQNPAVVQGAPLKAKSIQIATVTNQQALDYLTEANNRLVNVSNLIWETARSELLDGMAAGEGVEKLAARVARVSPQLAQPRAEVIARTEVVGASNAGSFAQAQMIDPNGQKTWLNAGDSRVRDSHRRVDPATVGMSETFSVGGAAMLRPHDPNGPARETVNCRCVLTYQLGPNSTAEEISAALPWSGVDKAYEIKEAVNAKYPVGGIHQAIEEGAPGSDQTVQSATLQSVVRAPNPATVDLYRAQLRGGKDPGLIAVVAQDGTYYVIDGNHRTVARILEGQTRILVRVLDLSGEPSYGLPPTTASAEGGPMTRTLASPPTLLAQAGELLTGAMIALVPADPGALAVEGGEPADQLHLTLLYLGDADTWPGEARTTLRQQVGALFRGFGNVDAAAFGVDYWNPDGEAPSWVLAVGDGPDQFGRLGDAHEVAEGAVYGAETQTLVPDQHTPWVAHVCLAYSTDPAMLSAATEKVGPVTFDKVRVAFAGEVTDVELEA